MIGPEASSVVQPQRIDVVMHTAKIKNSIRNRQGSGDAASSVKRPEQASITDAEGVDVPGICANIDDAIEQHWRLTDPPLREKMPMCGSTARPCRRYIVTIYIYRRSHC